MVSYHVLKLTGLKKKYAPYTVWLVPRNTWDCSGRHLLCLVVSVLGPGDTGKHHLHRGMKQPVIVFFWSFLIVCVRLWLVTWDQMDLLDVVQTYLRWHSFGVVIGRMELNLQQVTQNANFTPKMMINITNTWVWSTVDPP